MKIKKITVENFKAVSNKEINLNGCSAIITAANDKGKTSVLRGLIDRFKSEKPDVIVKEGEEKGFNIVELTDGSRIEWKFTDKSESFAYITAEGIKQTTGVISAIGEKYFGRKFDIDSFLNSTPKAQEKELQMIVGLDFSGIEERYKDAYEARTEANREFKRIASQKVEEPDAVIEPNIDPIKKEIADAREKNEQINLRKHKVNSLVRLMIDVRDKLNGTEFDELFDDAKARTIIDGIKIGTPIDITALEEKLELAQDQLRKFDAFEREQTAYDTWIVEGKEARERAERSDKKVKDIEQEKADMIAGAKMPDGFGFTDSGLTYKGFPLNENQISTSGKYIAALKLGAMVIGKVRTLHFDASSLDNGNLGKVQEWAKENDLQLLIERPDFDGGDIRYEIIEK